MIAFSIVQVQIVVLIKLSIIIPIPTVAAAFSATTTKTTFTTSSTVIGRHPTTNDDAFHHPLHRLGLTPPHHNHYHHRSSHKTALSSSTLPTTLPMSESILRELDTKNYVVIPNYLPPNLVSALREDIAHLRSCNQFKIAKIGQDSTNALDEGIRVAETCFLGQGKLPDVPNGQRETLYGVIEGLRQTLSGNTALDNGSSPNTVAPALDANLSELLYAYYPNGGFYRRHLDAIPQSVSILRSYSLLLYLNSEWGEGDGGNLRIHLDSGGDEKPDGEEDNFVDVVPEGGTLVLFRSDIVAHEVLDTVKERMAVVGWYNRPYSSVDLDSLASGEDKVRSMMLIAAVGLVTVGVVGLLV